VGSVTRGNNMTNKLRQTSYVKNPKYKWYNNEPQYTEVQDFLKVGSDGYIYLEKDLPTTKGQK